MKYDVNISLANQTKKEMVDYLETDNKQVLNKLGAFASLYELDLKGYKNPVLVLKTEEPGSKQLLAVQYNKIEGVCYDMINHLINDCIVMGSTPLTVQDAIICGKLDKDIVKRIVKTVAEACRKQGCVLTGGETSEQPKVLNEGTYVLTASVVGIVDKDNIIDGSKIKCGDVVIGVASSGLHTNGYTLVRKLMQENPEILNEKIDGKNFIDVILEPHRCYYQAVKDLFTKKIISGMAHITGGGICENLNRILPDNLNAEINFKNYKILPIFNLIQNVGKVSDAEMLRTYNMGVGLTIVADKKFSSQIINHIKSFNMDCYIIGEIKKGNKQVVLK